MTWMLPGGDTLTFVADKNVPPGVLGVIMPRPQQDWRPLATRVLPTGRAGLIYPWLLVT